MKAFLPPAVAAFLLAAPVAEAKTRAAVSCDDSKPLALWRSPRTPVAGRPLRIIAVTEEATDAELLITGPGGGRLTLLVEKRGGPPWSFYARVDRALAGSYKARLVSGGKTLACEVIQVLSKEPATREPPPTSAWQTTLRWERDTENLYAAWIEKLFDAPATETPSWPSLAPVIRDSERNFLFNHLGLAEDDAKNKKGGRIEPDCADLPYYLRAYFAWKMGLPVGLRDCSRGTATSAPRCGDLLTNEDPLEAKDRLSAFVRFSRLVANKAHSGSGRTVLEDDATDHYPVPLTHEALRPGTLFADPYGHTLVITKWVPQPEGGSGILFAVDAQPDNSIGRKRFWEGTFLWSSETKAAGPGFKAPRPVVRSAGAAEGAGPLVQPTNAELAKSKEFTPYSREQAGLKSDEFYAQMGRLINPRGVDAAQAYRDTLDALTESLKVRLGSVENGEAYMQKTQGAVIEMPVGPKIFETVGPWEDYATPSRDMRLIIAINVLVGLPERVMRYPKLFLLNGRSPQTVRDEVKALHARLPAERSIEYTRSDGSRFKLTVADVLARKANFEISYNPNDCVEVRWGATPGTPEHATCKRRAPQDQQARMGEYRVWFAEARRPPR